MIQHNATTFFRFVRNSRKAILLLAAVTVLAEVIYQYTDTQIIPLEIEHVGVFVTAMSIFLVFRVNEAYDRWWEARKLWGQLVNTSRSFARQAITLIEHRPAHRELVLRQIAYVNALRIALRHGPRWSDAPTLWAEIAAFIEEAELDELKQAENVPTQLIRLHGQQLRRSFSRTTVDHLLLCRMDESITSLCDIQGSCERIKNTVFPDRVARFTRAFVWVFAAALPFIILDASLDSRDIKEIILVTFMSFVLVTIERLGRELKNPFENMPNDTPMTALCRTIEIDLLQFLGETDLPPPVEPKNGVLM
jgi:ion channel-forming bestrophin family protein